MRSISDYESLGEGDLIKCGLDLLISFDVCSMAYLRQISSKRSDQSHKTMLKLLTLISCTIRILRQQRVRIKIFYSVRSNSLAEVGLGPSSQGIWGTEDCYLDLWLIIFIVSS